MDAGKDETVDSEQSSATRLPYSQCSRSMQSRRRAQLIKAICSIAGEPEGSINKSECMQLIHDTMRMPQMRTAEGEVGDSKALVKVMENIKALHEAMPIDSRTAILALVSEAFTGAELRTRWKLTFGSHQLQAARQLAQSKQFSLPVNWQSKKHPPVSKQPKSSEFVSRLHEFLDQNSIVDNSGQRVALRSLRQLHREFIEGDPGRNQISFSNFRSLAKAYVRLPSSTQGSQPMGSQQMDLATQLSLPQELLLPPMLQPMQFDSLLLSTQPPAPPPVSNYDIPTIQSIFDLAASSSSGAQQQPQQNPADSQPPDDTFPSQFFYL
ncbi:hypothetical protein IWW36_002777 [Coemansia brasiliensis]|uniref:Uncharacterized protein n=1 Tax=Coemansia brasiliensis TaxID=2650707 RepID=A0A9W8I6F5_9FUNG|nr:hypothetical protein IWW36_002777 [Coemansia brasiliensis]